MDESDEALPSNADSKVLKEYQRHIKKANSIISLNLVDNQLAHMKNCKGPVEVWKTLCNIYETKFVQHFFFAASSSRVKCNKTNNLLDHVKNVKVLTNQYVCLDVLVRDENIFMTLLKNLSLSYNNLITTLEMIPMKDLPIDCMIARLMHKILHHKET